MADRNRPVYYLILDEKWVSSEIEHYLAGLENCQALDLVDETIALRSKFRKRYIDLIADLNQINHSHRWWSLYFTRKECAYSNFGQTLFNCLMIGKIIEKWPKHDLVIVSEDSVIATQVSSWARGRGINTRNACTFKRTLWNRIKMFTIGRMALALMNAIYYWILLKTICRVSLNPQLNYVVFASLIDGRSFVNSGRYNDIYLGELPDFMNQNGSNVLVYGGMPRYSWKTLKSLCSLQSNFPIIPWHYGSTLKDILSAAWLSLCWYLTPEKMQGTAKIDGIDLDLVFNNEIETNLRSGHVFGSLWLFNSSKSLSKQIRATACVVPYENRSWEKMIFQGFRTQSDPIRVVGYHHAAVSPAHTNMLLGANESQVIPLPDAVVMTGEVTKEILEESGNYPKNTIKAGCALRRGRKTQEPQPTKSRSPITNVLVAMASSDNEYLATLKFLDAAFPGESGYQIGIRPHPEFSLDKALARLPNLGLNFQRMDGTLENNFLWADIVVYVSSTVGLDSIATGIPSVSIDMGYFTNYDPAPSSCPFKWTVSKPDQLVRTFQEIDKIPDGEYSYLQNQARAFGKRYFHNVTDASLKSFSAFITQGGDI